MKLGTSRRRREQGAKNKMGEECKGARNQVVERIRDLRTRGMMGVGSLEQFGRRELETYGG